MLDFFSEEGVEGFLACDRNCIFVRLSGDLLRDLVSDFLELSTEVLVNLSVSPIGLNLSQGWLLRSFDHELVLVGALHNC